MAVTNNNIPITTYTGKRLVKRALTDVPQRAGMIKELPVDSFIGRSLTDSLFLIGHADGLDLNSPYHVKNLQDAVNVLNADSDSPLLRALFDAYNEGARDIWLVAAAPMSEYVSNVADRTTVQFGGNDYYQQYHSRLDTTYSVLKQFDHPDIIVPVEAPFYNANGTDFLTQLANHCGDSLANTGLIRIGIIGTSIQQLQDSDITAMTGDANLASVKSGNNGRFVSIIGGEVSVSHAELANSYTTSAAVLAAAKLSTLRAERGLSYSVFNSAIDMNQSTLSSSQYSTLANAGINWIGRTKLGDRGIPFNVRVVSDNTLANSTSTFQTLAHVRVVYKVIRNLYNIGNKFIGNIGFLSFKQEVNDYMAQLITDRVIRNYRLNIYRSPSDPNTIMVDVGLELFSSTREVFFTVGIYNKLFST